MYYSCYGCCKDKSSLCNVLCDMVHVYDKYPTAYVHVTAPEDLFFVICCTHILHNSYRYIRKGVSRRVYYLRTTYYGWSYDFP